MIREAIDIVVSGHSLTRGQATEVMQEIMEGEATPAQLGAFLTALRLKGESTEEIAGMAAVMREKALRVDVEGPLLDVVGTGGDGKNTFNISTASAFVAAACGARVAKHGNRAASSSCGAADVLEALGVKVELTPDGVAHCIEQAGNGVYVRSGLSSFHALRRARASGDWHPHRLQRPGTPDQPGPRPVHAAGSGLRAAGGPDGRGAASAGNPARPGSARGRTAWTKSACPAHPPSGRSKGAR